MASSPQLSVILIAGALRPRAQRVIEALNVQTHRDALELVVVDLGGDYAPPLVVPDSLPGAYIALPEDTPWGEARAAGVAGATADLLAFTEDHCYPAPGWAEALLEAFQGPWATIGYTFVNANPQTYTSRASFMADYAPWAHPIATSQRTALPGNNVAYRRALLDQFGDDLPTMLSPDFLIQEYCLNYDLPMLVDARAVSAHENYERVTDLLQANHHYCRVLAAHRARVQGWKRGKRWFYTAAVPLGAPLIKLGRLLRSLGSRKRLVPQVLAAFPVILAAYAWSAVGEAIGYTWGSGSSDEMFKKWELNAVRSFRTP